MISTAKVTSLNSLLLLLEKPEAPVVAKGHFVQIYDTLDFLLGSLVEYLQAGYERNEGMAVFTSVKTWEALRRELKSLGLPVDALMQSQQLIWEDASLFADRVLTEAGPDRRVFKELLDAKLVELQLRHAAVRCYSEVVNILWERDQVEEGLVVEGFCNEYLAAQTHMLMMCGYSSAVLKKKNCAAKVQQIYSSHSEFILAENVDPSVADVEMLKRLGSLEQRLILLKAELSDTLAREAQAQEVLRRLTNIDKFASLSELCMILVHRLRDPLQVIKFTADLLLKASKEQKLLDREVLKKSSLRINHSTEVIAGLLRNVLETLDPKHHS